MTCQSTARIQSYMDGELSRIERKEMALHLETCSECRMALNELKQLSEWVDIALRESLTPLLEEQSLQANIDDAWTRFQSKLQNRAQKNIVVDSSTDSLSESEHSVVLPKIIEQKEENYVRR